MFKHQLTPLALIPPIGFAVAGIFSMQRWCFPLLDEVWIDETTILVRNRGREDRIPISDLTQITVHAKPYMTLELKEPTCFGRELKFVARFFQWPPAEEQLRRAHELAVIKTCERK
jgi:hypothetical protein